MSELASALQDYLMSKWFRVAAQLGAGDASNFLSVSIVCMSGSHDGV